MYLMLIFVWEHLNMKEYYIPTWDFHLMLKLKLGVFPPTKNRPNWVPRDQNIRVPLLSEVNFESIIWGWWWILFTEFVERNVSFLSF